MTVEQPERVMQAKTYGLKVRFIVCGNQKQS